VPARLDIETLRARLLGHLALGPSTARDALGRLGISQPAFSRLVGQSRSDLLVVGRGRGTRYAALRDIRGVGSSTPIYQIQESGSARKLAVLHAVRSRGFYLESADDTDSAFFEDLPYFLDDLRPSGFLGRLVPRRHPELEAPPDIQLWNADQCLAYICRYGWNLPGNLIVGDAAFRLRLQNIESPPDLVPAARRESEYPVLASDVMSLGVAGSSAAGEQPKFLASRTPGPVPVLVKFSPPVSDPVGQRLADLLVAEHVAHETLTAHGHLAARSEIVRGGDRVFLEVERFDRLAGDGRRGLISLFALDVQFVGRLHSWSDTATHLVALRKIDASVGSAIRWRELYGRLIANNDMHAANLSLFTDGLRVTGLAPAYDMLPMAYSVQQGHLRDPSLTLPIPDPGDAPIWNEVCQAAADFWSRLSAHPLVSPDFRRVAEANAAIVERGRAIDRLLPR
jgi:hypothetical protein